MEADEVGAGEVGDAGPEGHLLDTLLDQRRVLIDRGQPGALARGVRESVVGEDGSSDIEDGHQQQDRDREHERKLDQGLAPTFRSGSAGAEAHHQAGPTVMTNPQPAGWGSIMPPVRDW